MTADEEKELINKVRDGDKGAFELLVLHNQNNVYALAIKMLKNNEDALDAAQDAFLRAYLNISKFRQESKFSVWLYRITYNICLDKIRKTKNQREEPLIKDDDDYTLQIEDEGPEPEDKILSRETAELVRRGLDTLTPKLRAALILREVNGLSYQEIGEVMKIREGTVKSRINRARGILKEYLIRHGTFPDSSSHNNEKGGGTDA